MEQIKISDFLQYRFLSKLAFAPDGKHGAFVVCRAELEGNTYTGAIHLYDVATGEVKQLTGLGDGKSFFWLNDHELIFPAIRKESDRKRVEKGEKLTVFQKIDIRGGEASEYFRLPLTAGKLKQLDDGRFVVSCNYHPDDIDFTGLTGEEREAAYAQIKENRDYKVMDEIPFWYNGKGFINKKRNRLYLYDMAADKAVPFTYDLTEVSDFSVKGDKVLYLGHRYADKKALTAGLYLYDISTGETRTLVDDGIFEMCFAGFVGDKMVFCGNDMKEYGVLQNPNFYTVTENGYELLCLLDAEPGHSIGTDIHYGGGTGIKVYGDSIYFIVPDHVQSVLMRVSLDGKLETVIRGETSVDHFDICDSGIYFCGTTAERLEEIYHWENGKAVAITEMNRQFCETHTVSPCKRFDVQNGDVNIEGFVIYPVGYDPNKTYPAILHIHGGHKVAFGDVYMHEMQVWANLGYFVFHCNPRGSDGRGNAFTDLRGNLGGIDYEDLMAFTDGVLEAFPQIEKNHVGVTGGSYGGFMTNWIIGHTSRFACAVSQRSISNWVTKFGTTDSGYLYNAADTMGTPWTNLEKVWDQSPLKYACNCTTPTLFIHADQDYRCWQGEGIQMFTALKYHGIPARFCMFHGENHELSRSGKPTHRIRRMTEIVNWFEQYLK